MREVPHQSSPEFSDLDSLCDQCILISASLSRKERFPRPFQNEDLCLTFPGMRGSDKTDQMWRRGLMFRFFF